MRPIGSATLFSPTSGWFGTNSAYGGIDVDGFSISKVSEPAAAPIAPKKSTAKSIYDSKWTMVFIGVLAAAICCFGIVCTCVRVRSIHGNAKPIEEMTNNVGAGNRSQRMRGALRLDSGEPKRANRWATLV